MVLLKNCMLAVALIVGVSGAFVSKAANSGKVDDPKYNWTDARPGHFLNLSNKTVAQAQDEYGCEGSGDQCASGTRIGTMGDPKVTILQNN